MIDNSFDFFSFSFFFFFFFYFFLDFAENLDLGKRVLPPWKNKIKQGGRTRLPKFKFSAKFPIGLHVILQIPIRKFENDCYIMWKIILTESPSRFNVEPLLK